MTTIEEALITAQRKAEELFADVVDSGPIRADALESELSKEVHALANRRFGVRRHWHKRVVRCDENTLLTYHDEPPDLLALARLLSAGFMPEEREKGRHRRSQADGRWAGIARRCWAAASS